ncbi:ribosomal protein S3 (apicoplast) [Theileria orientalis]|uniref:Ribosomal protein S3 n=1 Tax=Theileria orientalis TaxID=68886 RepID=A0A976XJS3_THEOR|nr:ribosomal protein S3 [Theileria orientalis]
MSKIVSPILIRCKNVPNYINNLHIKLNKNNSYLTYNKFFNIILSFIYLFKLKIIKNKIFSNKLVYLYCNYYDFYNIHISLVFYKLKLKYLIQINKKLLLLSNYLNYFIKFNLHKFDYFIFPLIKKFKYNSKNIHHLITSIKNFIKFSKNFKKKIINFINSLLRQHKLKKNSEVIQGVKCIYSGCLYKNSKRKSFKYTKGNTSTTYIMSNILYSKKTLKTNRGLIGIKLWIYK